MLSAFMSAQLALGLVTVGGFIEPADAPIPRRVPTRAEITGFLPTRGSFTMPAPYGTQAIRVTTDADCGGSDCVNYGGYSYWRNINNHRGQPVMLVFVGLRTSRGGAGPSLFAIDKSTGAVTPLSVTVDHSGLTGFFDNSEIAMVEQDGFAEGTLSDFSVAADGIVNGIFTNGQVRTLARVVVARFANNNGLLAQGQSFFRAPLKLRGAADFDAVDDIGVAAARK